MANTPTSAFGRRAHGRAPRGGRGAARRLLARPVRRRPDGAAVRRPRRARLRSLELEYRRVGADGGWPMTFDDVRGAVAEVEEPLVTLGHSAGGQLALWLAAERGAALAVSQAGVVDLARGLAARPQQPCAGGLLGGAPDQVPDRYASASPAARLPLGVPQLLVHGRRDDAARRDEPRVCRAGPAHRRRRRARRDGRGHFECLDGSESWSRSSSGCRDAGRGEALDRGDALAHFR